MDGIVVLVAVILIVQAIGLCLGGDAIRGLLELFVGTAMIGGVIYHARRKKDE